MLNRIPFNRKLLIRKHELSRAYTRPETAGPTKPKRIIMPILYVSAYTCTEPIAQPEIRVDSDSNHSNMFEVIGRKLVILYYTMLLICDADQYMKLWLIFNIISVCATLEFKLTKVPPLYIPQLMAIVPKLKINK